MADDGPVENDLKIVRVVTEVGKEVLIEVDRIQNMMNTTRKPLGGFEVLLLSFIGCLVANYVWFRLLFGV